VKLLIHKGIFIILLMATTQQKNSKGSYTYKKRSPEEIASYKLALSTAENKLLNQCIPNKDKIDDIITNMTYLKNWKGYTHYVDISTDVITVDNHNFSMKRFLDNRFFKKKLYEIYGKKIGDVYLRTFVTSDNKFKIVISKRFAK